MAIVQERVDRLEDLVQDFVTNAEIQFNKLQNLQIELQNSQMRTEAE